MKILKRNKYTLLSKLAKYSFVFVIAFMLFMPTVFTQACGGRGDPCPPAGNNSTNTNPAGNDSSNQNPAGNDSSGVKITSGIKNPLGPNLNDIPSFIKVIIDFVLIIGVPIVALAIIYSGFLFVTAVGNSEKLKKAKQTLIYTLIGAALLLGAFVIANAIKGTVDEIKSTS